MRDTGSRQRRGGILQSLGLRRQRGELAGYSFQIRLLSCGALRERHQRSRVLLLRQLKIRQCRPDEGIRSRGWSRLGWRLRSEALEIGQREPVEVRPGQVIEIRQGEVIETRQSEAIGIRQGIGGGRTNDGQGGQGHHYRRHPARSHLLCRLRLLIAFHSFIRCVSHLRSLRVSPSRKIFSRRRSARQNGAVARSTPRRHRRECPPRFGINHGLVWLMISYSEPPRNYGKTSNSQVMQWPRC